MRLIGSIQIELNSSDMKTNQLELFDKKMYQYMRDVLLDGIYDVASEVGCSNVVINHSSLDTCFEART